MNEAEMAYKKPRPQPASAAERTREEVHRTVVDQSENRDDNAVVVTIGQLRKTVGLISPSLVSDRRTPDDRCISLTRRDRSLGALTEYGETLFLECTGSFTKDVTVRFLQTLRETFGKTLIVVLDQAPYFIAHKVKDFVEDTATTWYISPQDRLI
jgi:hypothetical protein